MKKTKIKKGKKKQVKPFILKTKLIPPGLKENTIFRQRLVSLLKDNLDKKLIFVVADAGYGKTTLLTQLIRDQNLPVVFYNLERTDSDLMVFLSYLMHGLEQLQSHIVDRSSALLEQGIDVNKSYELVIGTLINELVEKRDERFYLILDDYHTLLKDCMVHKALNYFIDHIPDTVCVIIASRTESVYASLIKWRAKQNIFELSRKELVFTQNEIKALFSGVYQVVLSDEELSRVYDYTEGWITGIQVILQSAGKDKKTVKDTLNGYLAANQPLFEYFANDILARENINIQDFLKYSSILNIMTPKVCDTVLGRKNSTQLLKYLEKKNLFLSLVGKGKYKYHHLFQQFLREQFKNKKLRKSLHLKAARFYKNQGQIEQAIEHYLSVGNYTQAGKFIVQIEGQMRIHARFTTLNTWLKQIPKSIFQKQPQLLTTLGRLYWMQGDLQHAERIFFQAEQLLKDEGDMLALADVLHAHGSLLLSTGFDHEKTLETFRKALQACSDSAKKLRVEILISIGTLYRVICDFKKARTHWLKAYRIAEQINDFHKLLSIGNNLAMLLLTQGELQAGFESFKRLIEHIGNDYWVEVGIIFTNAAAAALAHGELEWAEQCLDKGWALCRSYEDPFSKIGLHEGFALLYMYKEQWNLSEQHLFRAMDGCKKLQWAIVEFYLFGLMSRFYRYRGDFTKAKKYLELMRERLHKKQSIQETSFLIETSFLYIDLGQFERANLTIRKSMRLIKKFGLNRHKFFSYFVNASIYLARHKDQEASRFLRSAIRLAKVKGFNGQLARELSHNPRLLKLVQKNNIEKSYISSLNIPKAMPKLQLQVQCFGEFKLCDSSGSPLRVAWPTEKTRSLFTFLIAHRESPLHRDVILENLWPGVPKDRADGNFRTTASRMRQALANALSGQLGQDEIFIRQHGKYQLLPEVKLDIDTQEFDLLLKESERVGSDQEKAEVILRALDLYKGDYLPEVYDSWSDGVRRRFRERRLHALFWLARYSHERGDDLGCVVACETHLSLDPLSEEVVRLYMKSLSRLGRVAAVKSCYESLKMLMQKELHIFPSKETEGLYLSLMRYHSKL